MRWIASTRASHFPLQATASSQMAMQSWQSARPQLRQTPAASYVGWLKQCISWASDGWHAKLNDGLTVAVGKWINLRGLQFFNNLIRTVFHGELGFGFGYREA